MYSSRYRWLRLNLWIVIENYNKNKTALSQLRRGCFVFGKIWLRLELLFCYLSRKCFGWYKAKELPSKFRVKFIILCKKSGEKFTFFAIKKHILSYDNHIITSKVFYNPIIHRLHKKVNSEFLRLSFWPVSTIEKKKEIEYNFTEK